MDFVPELPSGQAIVGGFRDKRRRAENLDRMSLKDREELLPYMRLKKQVMPKEDTTSLLRPNGCEKINGRGLWKMVSSGVGQVSISTKERRVNQENPEDIGN